MKHGKRKKIIIALIAIIVIVLGFFGTLYYITSTVNNYSYTEKRWITDNLNKTIDLYVEPSLPVFSNNGTGVYYDYITALKEDTGLNINVITDDKSKIKLVNKNKVDDEDILFYRDHYVVIGTNNINKFDDLNYKKIGVIKNDKENVSLYLTEHKNINLSNYETFDELRAAYDSKTIDYMVIPMYKYLDQLLSNKYDIVYHLDGLYSYYVLDLDSEGDENFNSILTKFYYRYQDTANSKLNNYFLDIYYNQNKYTELQKESITNDDFIVGYIDNIPFEGMTSFPSRLPRRTSRAGKSRPTASTTIVPSTSTSCSTMTCTSTSST